MGVVQLPGLGSPGQDEEVDASGSRRAQGAGGFEGGGAGGHDVVDEEEACASGGSRGGERTEDVSAASGGRDGRLGWRLEDAREESEKGPVEPPRHLLCQESARVVAPVPVPAGSGGNRDDGLAVLVQTARPRRLRHQGSGGRGEDVVAPELQGVDEAPGDALVSCDGGRARNGGGAFEAAVAEGSRGREGAGLAGVVAVDEGKRPPARAAEAASADTAPGGAAGGTARREEELEEDPPGQEGLGPEGARHIRDSRRRRARLRKPDMHIDAPFSVPLSCCRMKAPRPPRLARALLLSALVVASATLSFPAAAQTFAVGVGGGILNDTGSAENLDNFSTAAGYGFVEMKLDPGVLMQARYTRMQLPPTAENGPDIDVDAATLTIAYLFKEDWWQAGFVAGGGGYFLRPKTPGAGQVETDPEESVFGLNGGLLTVFTVNRSIDIRLEAVGHLIRDMSRRKPVIVSAAVTWKF